MNECVEAQITVNFISFFFQDSWTPSIVPHTVQEPFTLTAELSLSALIYHYHMKGLTTPINMYIYIYEMHSVLGSNCSSQGLIPVRATCTFVVAQGRLKFTQRAGEAPFSPLTIKLHCIWYTACILCITKAIISPMWAKLCILLYKLPVGHSILGFFLVRKLPNMILSVGHLDQVGSADNRCWSTGPPQRVELFMHCTCMDCIQIRNQINYANELINEVDCNQ